MDPRTARLPGILPVEGDDWLRVDDAFAGQMAERDRLIAGAPDSVHALLPSARARRRRSFTAIVLDRLRETAGLCGRRCGAVTRPDGVAVALDRGRAAADAGAAGAGGPVPDGGGGDEHVLTGAILCFPASWTLAQKIGRPLTAHPRAGGGL